MPPQEQGLWELPLMNANSSTRAPRALVPTAQPQRPQPETRPGSAGKWPASQCPAQGRLRDGYLSPELDHVGFHLRVGLTELLDFFVQLLDLLVILYSCRSKRNRSTLEQGLGKQQRVRIPFPHLTSHVCVSRPDRCPPYSCGT